MQRVTPKVGNYSGPVEMALKKTFVRALFEGLREGVLERGVTRIPVKQVISALPAPPRRPLRTGRRPASSQDT